MRSAWTARRTTFWAVTTLVVAAACGPTFVAGFRPPDWYSGDFSQDWLSAQNYFDGHPVYDDLAGAQYRATGKPSMYTLPRNAHPPGSLLAALPFGPLDYRTAHLAWNLVTFPLFVAAVVLVIREVGWQPGWRGVLPVVSLTLLCSPMHLQVWLGNFGNLLALLLVLAWLADRRDWQWFAGAMVGLAAGVKLFPAFLVLYFVAAGRWRAVAGTVVAFLAVNGVALGLFGVASFRTYFLDVMPVTAVENASSWMNVSATGFWMRLFAPTVKPDHGIIPLVYAPLLAQVLVKASQLAVIALTAWAARVAATVEGRDRALAVAMTGMVLVSPISWSHSFLLLVVPVGLLLTRLPAGWSRRAMWAALVVVWLPANGFAHAAHWVGAFATTDSGQWHTPEFKGRLVAAGEQAARMFSDTHDPLSPALNLLAASPGNYAALVLFLVCLRLPRTPAREGGGA